MRVCLSLLFLTVISTAALAEKSLSIGYEDLPALIRKNNKSFLSASEGLSAARARTSSLDQSFYPKAGFEAGLAERKEADGSDESAPFWKLDLQANLYRGGRDKLAILTKESQVIIKDMDKQTLYRSELMKAKSDYIRLESIRRAIKLTRDSMDDFDGLKASVDQKVRAGLMTKTSLMTIARKTDDMKRELILLEREEHELEDRLTLVLGLDYDTPFQLRTSFLSMDQKELADPSIQDLPELRKLTLQAEAYREETKLRRDWWLPEVGVFASYTGFRVREKDEAGSLPQREMAFGIRLTVDLEARSVLNSEVAAKVSEISAIELQKSYLKREIEHTLHEYRQEMTTQKELFKTYDQGIVNSEALLKRLRSEFEKGIGDSLGISDIIESIYKMKRSRMETGQNFNLAKAGLETMLDLRGNP